MCRARGVNILILVAAGAGAQILCLFTTIYVQFLTPRRVCAVKSLCVCENFHVCSAHSEAQRLEVVVRRPLAGLLARPVREGHRPPARLVALEQERPALG